MTNTGVVIFVVAFVIFLLCYFDSNSNREGVTTQGGGYPYYNFWSTVSLNDPDCDLQNRICIGDVGSCQAGGGEDCMDQYYECMAGAGCRVTVT
jgi:hypothetical protein